MIDVFLRRLVFLLAACVCLAGCTLPDDEATKKNLEKFKKDLRRSWEGSAEVYDEKGARTRFDAAFEMAWVEEGEASRAEGRLTLRGESGAEYAVAFVMPAGPADAGRIGAMECKLRIPLNAKGRPEKNRVVWVGADEQALAMRFENQAFDLRMDGSVPFPEGPRWVSAHLWRKGFRFSLGPFDVTLMECLGIFATLVFASRFIVQWFASERAKKSVVPELFWWISLVGAVMMLAYGIYFQRLAVVFGQLTGWIVYSRNIWLIEREKRSLRMADKESDAQENAQDDA